MDYAVSDRFEKKLSNRDKETIVQTAFMDFAYALEEAGFSEQCEAMRSQEMVEPVL